MREIRVYVFDGKMHPVDNNEFSFKIAGLQAFNQAEPQLLEPIKQVKVLCSEALTGNVIGDLQSRRAIVEGLDAEGNFTKKWGGCRCQKCIVIHPHFGHLHREGQSSAYGSRNMLWFLLNSRRSCRRNMSGKCKRNWFDPSCGFETKWFSELD